MRAKGASLRHIPPLAGLRNRATTDRLEDTNGQAAEDKRALHLHLPRDRRYNTHDCQRCELHLGRNGTGPTYGPCAAARHLLYYKVLSAGIRIARLVPHSKARRSLLSDPPCGLMLAITRHKLGQATTTTSLMPAVILCLLLNINVGVRLLHP